MRVTGNPSGALTLVIWWAWSPRGLAAEDEEGLGRHTQLQKPLGRNWVISFEELEEGGEVGGREECEGLAETRPHRASEDERQPRYYLGCSGSQAGS